MLCLHVVCACGWAVPAELSAQTSGDESTPVWAICPPVSAAEHLHGFLICLSAHGQGLAASGSYLGSCHVACLHTCLAVDLLHCLSVGEGGFHLACAASVPAQDWLDRPCAANNACLCMFILFFSFSRCLTLP